MVCWLDCWPTGWLAWWTVKINQSDWHYNRDPRAIHAAYTNSHTNLLAFRCHSENVQINGNPTAFLGIQQTPAAYGNRFRTFNCTATENNTHPRTSWKWFDSLEQWSLSSDCLCLLPLNLMMAFDSCPINVDPLIYTNLFVFVSVVGAAYWPVRRFRSIQLSITIIITKTHITP